MKLKKRLLSLLLTLCLVLGMFPGTALAAYSMPFGDVDSNAWYSEAVEFVYGEGLMSGTTETTFDPNVTTTRGMLVTILHRMENTPAAYGAAFTDVPAGSWYADAVAWASSSGIVGGYGDGKFGPENPITREDLATILYRYAEYKNYQRPSEYLEGYVDAGSISSYAVEPMRWAVRVGVMKGVGDSQLDPKGSATRAQLAQTLTNLYIEVINKQKNNNFLGGLGIGSIPDTVVVPGQNDLVPTVSFTVNYDLNYGWTRGYTSETVVSGETASQPAAPIRPGYLFLGWYWDTIGGRAYDFTQPVTSNITLYAHWADVGGNTTTTPGTTTPSGPSEDLGTEGSMNNAPAAITNLLNGASGSSAPAEVQVRSFTVSEQNFVVQPAPYTVSVTFTAEISGSAASVRVVDSEGYEVATLANNGGTWTATVNHLVQSPGPATWYLKIDDNRNDSTATSIQYTEPYTEDQFTQYESIVNALETAVGSATDDATTNTALIETLDELRTDGALTYTVEGYYYSVKPTNGIPFIYSVAPDGVDAGSGDCEISTYQPYYGTYPASLDAQSTAATDGSAQSIVAAYPNYSFTGNYDRAQVTLDTLKNIGRNAIVMWHGHGGYTQADGSFLGTGHSATQAEINRYKADIQAGNLLISAGSDPHFLITGGFVDRYVGDMSGAMLYLAACDSGKDMIDNRTNANELAQAFINKGATAVIANSETIYTDYNTKMEKSVFDGLVAGKTLATALEDAKTLHGENDGSEYRAYPIIFPQNNANANNYKLRTAATGTYTVSGKVLGTAGTAIGTINAGTAVPNAALTVYDATGAVVATGTTNASGEYSFILPGSTAGAYYVIDVSASGYKPGRIGIAVRQSNLTVDIFLLVEASATLETSSATGVVTNAITNEPISGVSIKLRRNWYNQCGTTNYVDGPFITDSNGRYTITGVEPGYYTMELSMDGYFTTWTNIVVAPASMFSGDQNAILTPNTLGEGNIGIQLTWGEHPRDLDSHVEGVRSDGSRFHVAYYAKSASDIDGTFICDLDVDDVTSYGPENIRLNTTTSQPYYYYIHLYAGEGTLQTSGAHIVLQLPNGATRTFNVPATGTGSASRDLYWNVFAIKDGRLYVSDTITNSAPDLTYAGSLGDSAEVAAYSDVAYK